MVFTKSVKCHKWKLWLVLDVSAVVLHSGCCAPDRMPLARGQRSAVLCALTRKPSASSCFFFGRECALNAVSSHQISVHPVGGTSGGHGHCNPFWGTDPMDPN